MTSLINPNNINGSYPVAGVDNSSQGFRDNFTNIKNNFTYAASEISAIQANAILKNQFNDLGGATISNPTLLGVRETLYVVDINAGSPSIDFSKGQYQTLALTQSAIISGFTNWPSSGVQARMRLEVTVSNTNYTLTLPSAVTLNYTSIANISTKTISFASTGVYIFEFSTIDGGTNISVQDLTRNRNTIQGNLSLQTSVSGVATTGITMTVSNVGGTVVGNIQANNFIGNIISLGSTSYSLTGNLTANNVIANTGIYGTLVTALQPNVTLVGNLTSLSVTGNANIGNLTVNGLTDLCGAFMTGVQFVDNAVDGETTAIYSNVATFILRPSSASISSYTLTMPQTPQNGQRISIAFANTVTTLTMSGISQTVKGAYATGNSSVGGTWVYYDTVWYKT